MISSALLMAKRGRIEQPSGPVIDVTPEKRARLKELRKLKGLTQDQLANKIGVSNGTISNLETGRHGQVHLSTYMEIVALLEGADNDGHDERDWFRRVADKLLLLDGRGRQSVEAQIDVQIDLAKKSR